MKGDMSDDDLEALFESRPQDIHDDLLPVRPGLYQPDDDDIYELLEEAYSFACAIGNRKLPARLAKDLVQLKAGLEELLAWHRMH
jgi:hypothetical protein